MLLTQPATFQFIGCCWNPFVCLLLEFVEGGALNTLLWERHEVKLTWTGQLLKMALEIANACVYLHSFKPAPMIHRCVVNRAPSSHPPRLR